MNQNTATAAIWIPRKNPVYDMEGKQIGYTNDSRYGDDSMSNLTRSTRRTENHPISNLTVTSKIPPRRTIVGDLELQAPSLEALKKLRSDNFGAEARKPISDQGSGAYITTHKVTIIGLQYSPEKGFYYLDNDGQENEIGSSITFNGRLSVL